jgi:DNA (cytosine-5)-methyltransferase 1
VTGYSKNPALTSIIAYLAKRQYSISTRVLDAAHYGVPQHRERLIVQARRGPIAWPDYAPVRRSWHDALQDLFDTMEQAELANWQRQLWKPAYNALVPLIVYGHYDFRNSRDEQKQLDITPASMPARTVTSSHNNTHRRVVLADGRILRFSPRESARLQTFPDDYIWPAQVTLAQEIIGNAVPPLMVQRLTELYQKTA